MKEKQKQQKYLHTIATEFIPCSEDPMWKVKRYDVLYTNTGEKAFYFFAVDDVKRSFYKKEDNYDMTLDELAYKTLINHLEENPDGFYTGVFRFEFDLDNNSFSPCEEEPEWANYDCGRI